VQRGQDQDPVGIPEGGGRAAARKVIRPDVKLTAGATDTANLRWPEGTITNDCRELRTSSPTLQAGPGERKVLVYSQSNSVRACSIAAMRSAPVSTHGRRVFTACSNVALDRLTPAAPLHTHTDASGARPPSVRAVIALTR
jgi:hypothetical protein